MDDSVTYRALTHRGVPRWILDLLWSVEWYDLCVIQDGLGQNEFRKFIEESAPADGPDKLEQVVRAKVIIKYSKLEHGPGAMPSESTSKSIGVRVLLNRVLFILCERYSFLKCTKVKRLT